MLTRTDSRRVAYGALLLLTAVAAGAFGAHGLRAYVAPDLLAVWHTAVLYHLVHGSGLILITLLQQAMAGHPREWIWAGRAMLAGTLIFSGSLYALVLSGARWLGAITPLGGILFLVAWLLVAIGAWRHRSS